MKRTIFVINDDKLTYEKHHFLTKWFDLVSVIMMRFIAIPAFLHYHY